MLDTGEAPPCLRQTGETITAASREDADLIADHRDNLTVTQWEAYTATPGTTPPAPCPDATGDGYPGTIGIEAQEFADSAIELLPNAAPTISGGKAITGLRSWLDLGRPTTYSADRELNPGPFSVTASLTATATSTVDWGDGTITDHARRGGGYHEGEPGPADIVHTYTDTVDDNTLTVSDTWEIIVTGPGFDDIALTWAAPPVGITFDVDEVRSARDR
ncbi:MAG: hypothetical protein U5L04_11515 [Trueperaceae bacterium]|nr:hypothetical protein [Trueperaceae bacterium]